MIRRTTLRAVIEDDIPRIVALAAEDTDPREVMPPDDAPAPDQWTAPRREAYGAFLTSRLRRLDDGRREAMLLVEIAGRPAGLARIVPAPTSTGEQLAAEVGLWIVRRARGHGHALEVLDVLAERARAEGYASLVADTTSGNAPALATLQRAGAQLTVRGRDDGVVDAALDLRGRDGRRRAEGC